MNKRLRLTLVSLVVALGACAAPPPPPVATPASVTAPAVEPPPFAATTAAPTREATANDQRALRLSIFDAAWKTVRDKHYDRTLGGLDWNAVRARYEPLALAAPSEAAFYRVLNQMIGELGQSHMMITGPGADDDDDAEELTAPGETASSGPTAPSSGAIGDPGLTVRVIEGRPTITAVRARSAAERAGLQPGYIVTHIAGRELKVTTDSARPMRPVEERFAVRRLALRRLLGVAGTRVSVRFLDNADRPGQVVLVRDEPTARPVHVGHLPPLYPEVHARQQGDVGIIAFNIFLLDPVLGQIQRAIDGFRTRGVHALILDLRGNPGGHGAMAIPVASRLVDAPLTLGTIQFRDFAQTLVARPEMGVTPFLGPVAILTDEGTASASEILAAGLQEAKRAVVVGDSTLGAALPSLIEALPGGAVMQYVVADFRTPKGVLLEGRGVQPDKRVLETRAGLRTGRDPVLDAALVAIRASRPR
ncbi:MAG TPA: S41 family peptidase [Polyangia bacterium]|jgi:carboxyl-terminal processing protease|nr:S41 family peptidase [Polyangia bacterium]